MRCSTIPDIRASMTYEATVTFRETPAGVPPAVRSLFYGGEYRGYEFVYPKGGPNMIPPPVPLPEITYSTTPAPAAEPVVEPAIEPLPAEPTAEPVSGACSARAGAHSQPAAVPRDRRTDVVARRPRSGPATAPQLRTQRPAHQSPGLAARRSSP